MTFYNIFHGYRLLRVASLLLVPAVYSLVLIGLVGSRIYSQVQTENKYEQEYGAMWTQEYEKREGALYDQRLKLALCSGGTIAVCITAYFYLQDDVA